MKHKFSGLRISSFAIILVITVYYLIIFAHVDLIIEWSTVFLTALGITFIPTYLFIIAISIAVPVIEFPTFLIRIIATTVDVYKPLVIIFVFLSAIFSSLLIIPFAFGGWGNFQQVIIKLLLSPYVAEYHSFWIFLVCLIFYSLMFERVRQSGNILKFIESFKALPLVSPVFCFGAPSFWNDSLTILGLPTQAIHKINVVSFLSGIAFLLSLILFFVFKHIDLQTESLEKTRILVPGQVTRLNKDSSASYLSLALIFLGLMGISFVILHITYLVLIT